MSFNCVTKIQFFKIVIPFDLQRFAKIIECILTRKQLKEIELSVKYYSYLDYENIFPKNLTVEEISLWGLHDNLSSKIWIKMFDALPNIKAVRLRVVGTNTRNVVVILKNLIRAFKGLKSLHFAWIDYDKKFDSQLNDCYNFIKENFPLKSKVIIATSQVKLTWATSLHPWYNWYELYEDNVLKNQIVKEEGKPPKIVPRGSPGSISTWTDHEYKKFKCS